MSTIQIANRLSEIKSELTYLVRCGNNSMENAIKWMELHREREQLESSI